MMAESAANDADDWKEVEKQVTCSICNDLFVEPKTIACFHTFCEKCIQSLENNSTSGRDCPICGGAEFPKDLTKVSTNRSIQYKVDIVSRRKSRKCGSCIDKFAPAVKWCVDCEHVLCEECHKQHKRMKTLLSHKIVPVELFKGQSPSKVFSTICQPEFDGCKKHSKPNDEPQPLNLYCKTCDLLICQFCARSADHRQHQYHIVNKLADEERAKMRMIAAPLTTTLLEQVNIAIKKVEDSDNELNNETASERQVQDMYRQWHKKLDQYEEKDLQKVKTAKSDLESSLGSQKEDLKSLRVRLVSYDEFISKVTATERDSQLLTHSSQVQKKVNDLTDQVQQASSEQVDQLILSPNDITHHFTSLFTISTLPHVPYCSVKGPPAMSKYGPVNVTIILKDKDKRPVPNQAEHLTVHFNDENIASNVKIEEDASKNVYMLSYKAKKRERHSLSVSWKGNHLDEITVQVKIRDYLDIKKPLHEPITKYGKPQDEMKLTCPHLMVCGPNNELIVRDCHVKTLVVFDDDMKFSHMIAFDGPPPTGLAINSEYLYMSIDHAIKKIDMDGKVIFQFGTKGTKDGQFQSPRGLALTKPGLLYICDKDNHRIQVLKENHFWYTFGNRGSFPGMFNEPYDLAFNNAEDLLFITDCGNHRIQLFTPSGQFLKLFGTFTAIPGKLRYPTGICYTPDDHVLICSSNNHYMLIFKEDGKFVSLVPIEGTEDGKQAYADPVGVVMKSDGRIIVAGCRSNKLIVF